MFPHRSRLPYLLFLATAAFAVQSSCRPASYEMVKIGKQKRAQATGTPTKVDSPEGPATTTPAPTHPGADANLPPTARVEVIWNGTSVTKVRVGEPVSIQPSADTVDLDDVGVSQCANPGIVKAAYEVGAEAKPVAERPEGCESLAVPYTFTKPGDYVVTMVVTTDEGETALARMTLTVLDASAPIVADGGFTIAAAPMVAGIGEVVTFTGRCELTGPTTITWDFGDGKGATGKTVTHAYDAEGQKDVKATCTDTAGHTKTAELTIVVLKEPIALPTDGGDDTGMVDGGDDGMIGGGDDGATDGPGTGQPGQGHPGQGQPGQGQPGQGQPGQGQPGQDTKIVID